MQEKEDSEAHPDEAREMLRVARQRHILPLSGDILVRRLPDTRVGREITISALRLLHYRPRWIQSDTGERALISNTGLAFPFSIFDRDSGVGDVGYDAGVKETSNNTAAGVTRFGTRVAN